MGILNVQGVVAPRDGHCLHLFTVIHISVRVYGVEGDLLGALHPQNHLLLLVLQYSQLQRILSRNTGDIY